MLPDSMNVGVIAENIKKLEAMVKEAGSELPTPGAGDTGKILKVGSNGYELATEYSYTPPAYSAEEVNTGRKWIDGRDVYEIVMSGAFPTITETSTQTITGLPSGLTILRIDGMCLRGDGNATNLEHFSITYQTTGNVIMNNVSATYSEGSYDLIILFVKPAPVPGNETKKKTSKKGE